MGSDRLFNTPRPPRGFRGGGFGPGMGGFGANPMDWSLRLYHAWGIDVRVHLLFIVLVAIELITAASRGGLDFRFRLVLVVGLFIMVLLHEYGHCIAARRVGGDASRILMWPLGGLASVSHPPHWTASFWTTAGGPLVNVLLFPVFALGMFAVTRDLRAVFVNPLNLGPAYEAVAASGAPWFLAVSLLALHVTNLVLLGFNVLLPMYPLDGGRLLQSLLWWKLGYRRSLLIASTVGLVAAVGLGIASFAGLMGASGLGIAMFAGFTCYNERRRAQFMPESDDLFEAAAARQAAAFARDNRRADAQRRESARAAQAADKHKAEIDRILAKISASGMQSLTSAEKRTLERASKPG